MATKFKEQKALNAILYIAHELIKKSPERRADLYKLQKILYFADRYHLAKYGRLITGDFYIAMKDGPVPSRTYDMLKKIRGDGYYNSTPSFIDILNKSFRFDKNISIIPLKSVNKNELAESDIEAIDYAINLLKNLSFNEIKKLSHDSAYNHADESNNMSLESIAKAGGANTATLCYLNTWSANQSTFVA